MTGPRFKICGVTRIEDALLAADLGAHAIGLNFWPRSKRHVSLADAEPIVAALRARGHTTRLVGVFVDALLDDVVAIRDALALDLLQLHGDEPPEALAHLGPSAFKAIALDGPAALDRARTYGGPHILVDAAVAGHRGGTGERADWALAATLSAERAVWLAGGITHKNAQSAFDTVRPVLLDVASGAELPDNPRHKSPHLLRLLLGTGSR